MIYLNLSLDKIKNSWFTEQNRATTTSGIKHKYAAPSLRCRKYMEIEEGTWRATKISIS